jgi:polyisoprenyl-phosphate glycosyltransferase
VPRLANLTQAALLAQYAPVEFTLIIPCFNEEDGLDLLRDRLCRTLPEIAEDFEVILVDDGSTDGTLAALRGITDRDSRFRYLALSRNFGKEAAMLAGLSRARGEMVGIIDADLQHPPELLLRMVELCGEGYDQVVARRTRTGDPRWRSVMSRFFYLVINRMIDVKLRDGCGDFRVLSRKAVEALLALGESNRFSKGLFVWIGFDTATVDYENVPRRDGRSRWTLRKLLDHAIDGVLAFNNRPLRAAVYLGVVSTVVALGYASWVLGGALVNGNPVPGYVTAICGVFGLGGVQLLILGVLGEYLGRIYGETKRRPHFLVKETCATRMTVEPMTGRTRTAIDGWRVPAGSPENGSIR